jgi:hypothetical protein
MEAEGLGGRRKAGRIKLDLDWIGTVLVGLLRLEVDPSCFDFILANTTPSSCEEQKKDLVHVNRCVLFWSGRHGGFVF